MSQTPNYRPACGESESVPPTLWLGGCFTHLDSGLEAIKIKRNVTLMKDYASGSDYNPNGIDPYSWAEQQTAPDCSPFNNGGCPDNPCYHCGDIGGTGNGNFPCGIPPTFAVLGCGAGSSSFDVGPYHNCYVQTQETKSYDACRFLGFKNAYAHKNWHGSFAYNSRMNGQLDSWQWCCTCVNGGHHADETADHTKYLALSATSNTSLHTNVYNCTSTIDGTCTCLDEFGNPITIDNACPDCVLDHSSTVTANASCATHVDKFGNLYVDACSSGSGGCTGDPDTVAACEQAAAEYAFNLLGAASANIASLTGPWCQAIAGMINMSPDVIDDNGGPSKHIEYHTVQTCYDHCGNITSENSVPLLVMDIDTVGGTLDIYTYGPNTVECGRTACTCTDCCAPWIQTSHRHWSFGGTSMTYFEDATGIGSISLDQQYHEQVNGSFGSPYTATDVHNDIVTLLSYLPLDRDDLFPWRTDGNVTKGPVAYYDEFGPTAPSIQCQSVTGSSGKVYGIPAPPGMDHVFDPTHKNYCTCDSLVQPGCLSYYVRSYGAWNDEIGGGSATAWLNAYESSNVLPEAFEGHGFFFTTPSTCNSNGPSRIIAGTVWAGKYAEIIFPKQSFNYARPCGADRFLVSGSSARCIDSFTARTLTLDSFGGPPTDIQTGDYVWVCGTTDLDGAWIAQRDGDYQITLTDYVVSASFLPTSSMDCGTGIVARIARQDSHGLATAICGTLDIVAANNQNPVTCSFNDDVYLTDKDSVRVTGAKGLTVMNGVHQVKVVAPKQIALVGVNGISQSVYLGSGVMTSPFAPDPKWNDTSPKNDLTTIQWNYNYRDVGEYIRLSGSVPFAESEFQCVPPNDPNNPPVCPDPPVPPRPRPNLWNCYDPNVTEVKCDTSCLPFNACYPQVAFFSPNSETFHTSGSVIQSAKNYGWGSVLMDEQYGALWQGAVKQSMGDPLFIAPPCPCQPVDDGFDPIFYACNCFWDEDSGDCLGDTTEPCQKYYAHRPVFEARCEVPTGAPALPGDAHLGCLKVSDYKDPNNCPDGNPCWAPFSDANNVFNFGEGCGFISVFPWATPWITYLSMMNCVCNNGRFAVDYGRNGIVCDNDLFVQAP